MSFFKGTLNGNLGRDPETFTYGSDKKNAVRLSVAVKDGFGDDAKTTWVKATCFGKKAEVIAKHFAKGDGIILMGSVKLDTYKDKESGADRSALAMMVDDFDFCGKKNGNGGGGSQASDSGSAPRSSSSSSASRGSSRQSEPIPDDDEIPF